MGAVLDFHTVFAGTLISEGIEISTKAINSKGPGRFLPGPIPGANGGESAAVFSLPLIIS
jgi:hypothetical protein